MFIYLNNKQKNIIYMQLIIFIFITEEYKEMFFFFFQAEDGIRDPLVTGVQTCALPISPPADRTVDIIQRFGQLLTGAHIAVDLLHVGEAAPPVHAVSSNAPALPPVILRSGHVVQSIVDAAIEFDADVIAMPTAGHDGVLDALRGSTTERVIRHAPCPVLALPAAFRRSRA